MYDVIIVGGGMGGLATGALLSRKGFKVMLLEQNRMLGGRANSVEYKKGYTVDWGIHLLRFGSKGIAAQVFETLGEKLEILEMGEGKLFHNDQWLELPTKADVLTRTPLLDGEDKKSVGGLLTGILGTPPQKVLDLSIADWLSDVGGSERIKMVMQLISKLCITTHSAGELSSGEVFSVISGALKTGKSAGYPRGGWKTAIERLSSIIQNEGGIVREKAKVEKIVVDERKIVVGVLVGGERLQSSVVVYSAPCQQLHSLVSKSDFGEAFLERSTNMIPTAGISIDLGLRGCVSNENGMVVVNDPFILAQFTSNIDSTVAPSGEQLATFLHVMSPTEMRDRKRVEGAFEVLERYAFKMFPRLRGSIVWKRKTEMDIVNGVLPTPLQSREKRIGFIGPVKGLYFAGDCYDGEGGGSDIAFRSARRCAEVIEKR
ncbi:MAG: FAD-dependent oxidoreductase [Promethearchaeati archaeon SRVP18_Atabeyarchaeia-1]